MHITDPKNKQLMFSFLVWIQNFIKSNNLFQEIQVFTTKVQQP
jgi:hypothetical protein